MGVFPAGAGMWVPETLAGVSGNSGRFIVGKLGAVDVEIKVLGAVRRAIEEHQSTVLENAVGCMGRWWWEPVHLPRSADAALSSLLAVAHVLHGRLGGDPAHAALGDLRQRRHFGLRVASAQQDLDLVAFQEGDHGTLYGLGGHQPMPVRRAGDQRGDSQEAHRRGDQTPAEPRRLGSVDEASGHRGLAGSTSSAAWLRSPLLPVRSREIGVIDAW